MLKVIATESLPVIDALREMYAPEKITSNHMADVYRKGNTFYLSLKKAPSVEMVTWIASEFLPERLYFPYLGYSVDMIHEIGDVIVPNVFLEYSNTLEQSDISKENRDNFVGRKMFIENFSEQKDYYVEDFGLSLGGILVTRAPEQPSVDLHEKLMLAYEADIYATDDVFRAIEVLSSDEVPTLILSGVVSGKPHAKYAGANPIELSLRNIMTTIDLLESEDA